MNTLHYSTKNVLLVVLFILCVIASPPCVQGRRLRVLISDEKREVVVVTEKEYSKSLVKEVPSSETQLPDSGEKKPDAEVGHKQAKNLVKGVPSGETQLLDSSEKKSDPVEVQHKQTKNLVKEVPSAGETKLSAQHKQTKLPDPDELVGMDYTPMSNKPPVHN